MIRKKGKKREEEGRRRKKKEEEGRRRKKKEEEEDKKIICIVQTRNKIDGLLIISTFITINLFCLCAISAPLEDMPSVTLYHEAMHPYSSLQAPIGTSQKKNNLASCFAQWEVVVANFSCPILFHVLSDWLQELVYFSQK